VAQAPFLNGHEIAAPYTSPHGQPCAMRDAMIAQPDAFPTFAGAEALPETPHELPLDRGKIDDLVDRARAGVKIDLLDELLQSVDWSGFVTSDGEPLREDSLAELRRYYRQKWSDIGPLFLAELLSTEFMTEQRARGDVIFSERLLQLGRTEPELWQEIRQFFRRKEMVTALLASAHEPSPLMNDEDADDEEEDLWE
jgi:hypothetical protein